MFWLCSVKIMEGRTKTGTVITYVTSSTAFSATAKMLEKRVVTVSGKADPIPHPNKHVRNDRTYFLYGRLLPQLPAAMGIECPFSFTHNLKVGLITLKTFRFRLGWRMSSVVHCRWPTQSRSICAWWRPNELNWRCGPPRDNIRIEASMQIPNEKLSQTVLSYLVFINSWEQSASLCTSGQCNSAHYSINLHA